MIKKYIKFFLFTCLCFIIADVFVNADTLYNNGSITFFNNNGSSVNQLSTDYISQIDESSATITTISNSYGGLVVLQLSTPLIQNHIYTLFLNVGAESNGGYTKLSSKNCLGIGNSVSNSANNYVNNCISPKFSDFTSSSRDKTRGVYYTFISNKNSAFLAVPYTTQYTCNDCRNYSFGYTINDGGDTTGLTESQVNNLISNQTTIIQNQINNMSEDINNTINDNFNDCEPEENISFSTINGYELKGNAEGDLVVNNNWLVTSYIPVKYGYSYTQSGFTSLYVETYDSNHNRISSLRQETFTITDSNVKYIRLNSEIQGYSGKIIQNKKCTNKIDKTNEELGDINDSINNSDTSGAQDSGGGFFNDFTTDTHGLTAIITAPLSLISSITSKSCSPLVIPLPYVDKDLTLPCMGEIYSNYFGSFLSIYQLITFGIVAYWVCVRIFNLVKDFKNPDHDEIEVLDL